MEPIWAKMGPDGAKMAPRWAVMEIKIDAKMPSLVDLIFSSIFGPFLLPTSTLLILQNQPPLQRECVS